MYKVSTPFQLIFNAQSYITLLDFAKFVYVFNIKTDFQISKKYSTIKTSYTTATLSLLKDKDGFYYS